MSGGPPALASASGRIPGTGSSGQRDSAVMCLVPGCSVRLAGLDAYTRRSKTCKSHRQAEAVKLDTGVSRFCQQCNKFHAITEFSGTKRGCDRKLAKHNKRQLARRRAQIESLQAEGVPARGKAGASRSKGLPGELAVLVQLVQQRQLREAASAPEIGLQPTADKSPKSGRTSVGGLSARSFGFESPRAAGATPAANQLEESAAGSQHSPARGASPFVRRKELGTHQRLHQQVQTSASDVATDGMSQPNFHSSSLWTSSHEGHQNPDVHHGSSSRNWRLSGDQSRFTARDSHYYQEMIMAPNMRGAHAENSMMGLPGGHEGYPPTQQAGPPYHLPYAYSHQGHGARNELASGYEVNSQEDMPSSGATTTPAAQHSRHGPPPTAHEEMNMSDRAQRWGAPESSMYGYQQAWHWHGRSGQP